MEALMAGRRYWSPLIDALTDRGIEHIDVVELLREDWEQNKDSVFTGTHLSPGSNRKVAEAVGAWF